MTDQEVTQHIEFIEDALTSIRDKYKVTVKRQSFAGDENFYLNIIIEGVPDDILKHVHEKMNNDYIIQRLNRFNLHYQELADLHSEILEFSNRVSDTFEFVNFFSQAHKFIHFGIKKI